MMLSYPGLSKSDVVDQHTWDEIEFLLVEAVNWRQARLHELATAIHAPEKLNKTDAVLPSEPVDSPVDKFSAGLARLARVMGANEDLPRRIETRAKAQWLMKQVKVEGE